MKIYENCTLVVHNVWVLNGNDKMILTDDDADILIINDLTYIDRDDNEQLISFTHNELEYELGFSDLISEIDKIVNDEFINFDETLLSCDFTIYDNNLNLIIRHYKDKL